MHGGKRGGAGRPRGARNSRTREIEAKGAEIVERLVAEIPDAFEGDAHALLVAVYKNPAHDWPLRIDAAKAAVRFEKPALQATTIAGDPDGAPIAFEGFEWAVVYPSEKAG